MISFTKPFALLLCLGVSQSLAYLGPCLAVTGTDLKNTPQNKDQLVDLPKGGKNQWDWKTSEKGFIVSKHDNIIEIGGSDEIWQRNFARIEYDRKPNNDVSATVWYYLDRDRPCLIQMAWDRVAGGQIYHVSGSD